jgi:hypothetical protein
VEFYAFLDLCARTRRLQIVPHLLQLFAVASSSSSSGGGEMSSQSLTELLSRPAAVAALGSALCSLTKLGELFAEDAMTTEMLKQRQTHRNAAAAAAGGGVAAQHVAGQQGTSSNKAQLSVSSSSSSSCHQQQQEQEQQPGQHQLSLQDAVADAYTAAHLQSVWQQYLCNDTSFQSTLCQLSGTLLLAVQQACLLPAAAAAAASSSSTQQATSSAMFLLVLLSRAVLNLHYSLLIGAVAVEAADVEYEEALKTAYDAREHDSAFMAAAAASSGVFIL